MVEKKLLTVINGNLNRMHLTPTIKEIANHTQKKSPIILSQTVVLHSN
jgi:hypothetical protein